MMEEWESPEEFDPEGESHLERNLAIIIVAILVVGSAFVVISEFGSRGEGGGGGEIYSNSGFRRFLG